MIPLVGVYINLDRCADRAVWMQAQLDRLDLEWVRRQPAIDGAVLALPAGCPLLAGEYACFLSHLQAIAQAPADAWLLVLEDDTELAAQMPELLARAVAQGLGGADILFLECQPHYSLAHVSALWEAANRHLQVTDAQGWTRRVTGVELLDARLYYKWGLPAYVVSPAGRLRLLALLQEWLDQGPQRPIDRCIEEALARDQLRGALTMPFLATTGLQWHGRSSIGNGWRVPLDAFMVLRRLLFAGGIGEVEHLTHGLLQARDQADPALRMLALVLQASAAMQRDEVRDAWSGQRRS